MLAILNDELRDKVLSAIDQYNTRKQQALIDLMVLVNKSTVEPNRKNAMQDLLTEMCSTDACGG